MDKMFICTIHNKQKQILGLRSFSLKKKKNTSFLVAVFNQALREKKTQYFIRHW